MKLIPLTKGKFAKVDDGDYDNINQWSWMADKIGNTWYAYRFWWVNNRPNKVYMHSFILNTCYKKYCIDHSDGDGLNNTRSNIRVCTSQQNQSNQRKQTRKTSSKYKGVTLLSRKYNNCDTKYYWLAQTKFKKQYIYIGLFSNEIDAAKSYDKKAIELFGEFANLNFPI